MASKDDGDFTRAITSNDPVTAISAVTYQIVACGRQFDEPEDQIRKEVTAAIREALEGGDGCREILVETPEGSIEECVTAAGLYRAALDRCGIDRANPWVQEKWFALAMHAMERALKIPTKPFVFE